MCDLSPDVPELIAFTQIRSDFNGIFVDVGANVGDQTVKWALQFPNVKIIAFEPNPVTCRYLVWNIMEAGARGFLPELVKVLGPHHSSKNG